MIYIPVTAEENCEVFLLEKRGMMFSSFTDNLCVLQMAIRRTRWDSSHLQTSPGARLGNNRTALL